MVGGNDIMISIILFDVLLFLLLFDVLILDIVLIGIGSMILSLLDGVLIFVFDLSLLFVLLMFRMI